MSLSLHESITRSMDLELDLVAVLPSLFEGINELGARTEDVETILQQACISTSGKALDLGCGKGAVTTMLADKFTMQAQGVDGCADFIKAAKDLANHLGVGSNCTFANEDLRHAICHARGYDLVLLLALGEVLGETGETINALRQCVRPGGHMLIDGAFWDEAHPDEESIEAPCPGIAETRKMLQQHGDRIVAELRIDHEGSEYYQAPLERLSTNASHLAQQHPELGASIQAFVTRQLLEIEALCNSPLVGALWVLERATD